MQPKLVPLRISSGWSVGYNNFLEISTEDFIDDTYPYEWDLNEDILQFSNEYRKRILDLGWYPSSNPKGQYRIVLIELCEDEDQAEKWDSPLFQYCSRDTNDIKDKINFVLQEVATGRL
ncbi:hypothetical protein I6N90_03450 [Paenibacillus sp. GSMTC-2017]|uniref:hypothetical protein n=1 Tax=Paenibacillus sp. GSMTC-2017 TaxID=2794350 RepID=UPI0018D9FED7|nr:hypothetical protein [Paenibacillus sp. GSMTC-2017]MBH5316864.1 hypothetical protein [Paenibacillus sp. GSMTC-2017]